MKYKIIDGSELPPLPPIIGLDIETKNDDTGLLHPYHTDIRLVQIAISPDKVFLVKKNFQHLDFTDSLSVGHNLSFDIQNLMHHCRTRFGSVYDTMVAEGTLNAARRFKTPGLNLKVVTQRYLKKDRDKDIAKLFGNGSPITPTMLKYAAEDASDVLLIREKQLQELSEYQPSKTLLKLEMKLVPVLAGVSYRGMKIDSEQWRILGLENFQKLERIDRKLSDLLVGDHRRNMFGGSQPSFNTNSHVVLKRLLESKGITVPNTQRDTLEYAYVRYSPGTKERRILELLSQRSVLQQAVSTYGENWLNKISPKTGRVHMSWFQTKPRTGRLSAGNPNTTNVPIRTELGKRYRACFVPDDGCYMIKADYAQQEARIMAFLSGDKRLLEAFHVEIDPYLLVARYMYNDKSLKKSDPERDASKTIVLGLFYGLGKHKLAAQLGCTVQEAEENVRKFKNLFPVTYAYAESVIESAERLGYAETVIGRRRWGDPTEPGFTGTMRNLPIQGTAADMLKLAAVIFHERIDYNRAALINLVHDELLIESVRPYATEAIEVLRSSMLDAAGALVDVPFVVDISCGYFWGDNSVKIEKAYNIKE